MSVIEPLTKEQLEEWAKALESGKYEQGMDGLEVEGDDLDDNGNHNRLYCCLGVLAKSRGELKHDGSFKRNRSGNQVCFLTGSNNDRAYYLSFEMQERMATMNDEEGCDFEDIAAFIREELIPKARK